MRSSEEPRELKCTECQEVLEEYLKGTLGPVQDEEVRSHLGSCESCFDAAFTQARERAQAGGVVVAADGDRDAAFARARERAESGKEARHLPRHEDGAKRARPVLAFLRAILAPAAFPGLYSSAPALMGALDDQMHIYTTADQQFLVEITPLAVQEDPASLSLEIAVRAHDATLRGGTVRYRVLASGEAAPLRTGEATLDEDGIALVRVSLPITEISPYRIEVEAYSAGDDGNG